MLATHLSAVAEAEVRGEHAPYRLLVVPKRRRPTRPTKGSVERRIGAKKVRGVVKALCGKVDE